VETTVKLRTARRRRSTELGAKCIRVEGADVKRKKKKRGMNSTTNKQSGGGRGEADGGKEKLLQGTRNLRGHLY